MKKRIFLAINLPKGVKKKLISLREDWADLPAKWTKPENLHITLSFLGHMEDDEVLSVCREAEKLASRENPFKINLLKTCYAPPGKEVPRMVWAIGEKGGRFSDLKRTLEKSLGETEDKRRQTGDVSPHITLARIRKWDWQKIEPEDRPEIEKDLNVSFQADSFEVMESRLKRGGPDYVVLESFFLGQKNE
jgi:RNA 2',3'-cyclic 3'-phosphodiesterase